MLNLALKLNLSLLVLLLGLFISVKAASGDEVITVSDANFNEVVLAEKNLLVAVDFWAAWCGPCKRLAPILEKLAVKYKGRVKFVKLNVDENKKMSAKYQISSIPNVKFFKNGLEVDEFVGLLPQAQIEKLIDKRLKKL